MSRTYTISIIFLIVSLVSYSIIEWHQANTEQASSIDSDLIPDFIAESLNSDTFSKDGRLSYIIDADRMEHYAELAVTYFEFPKYTLYPKSSEAPWKVSANEGTLYDNNRVKLENKVTLVSTDNESLIQEIHGKYLELDLDTNIISSENNIEIKGVDFTMYGSGLIVDLDTKQFTLTKHDQTIYKKN